jgi:hypothetical protein
MRTLIYGWIVLVLGCAALGCGKNANSAFGTVGASIGATVSAGQAVAAGKAQGAIAEAKTDSAIPIQRKIIYTATLRVVVDNFSTAWDRLERLVNNQTGSFIARSEISSSSGSPTSGTWTIRVPVELHDSFIAGAAKLGSLERMAVDSKDVTEEYFDVEARINNKRVQEKRLNDLLQKSTGKLTEILTVENEISRVRGEAEQLQGRLNVISNLAALSTVNIQIVEKRETAPPPATAFGDAIERTFSGSVDVLASIGKAIVLVGVGIAPWMPVLAVVVGLAALLRRKARRVPAA